MKNTILIAAIVLVLAVSVIAVEQGPGTPPQAPPQPEMGTQPQSPQQGPGTPPQQPSGPDAGMLDKPSPGNDAQPLRERLEEFYSAKEGYIMQKKQCKESAVKTNAAKGTCWDTLKPLMLGLLRKEIMITERRLVQLRENNLTLSNIDEINATIMQVKTVFANQESSKELIKSTANKLEQTINEIEEAATQNQPKILIAQMDNLIIKSDELTVKLEIKLMEIKALGIDVTQLQADFNEYKANLVKTKENVASAKTAYAQSNSAQDVSATAKQVRKFINDAKNSLEKAFDKAKAMAPQISNSENNANQQSAGGSMNQTPQEGIK